MITARAEAYPRFRTLAVIMTIILLAVSVPYLRYTFRQIDD